jgi:diguanylate cyclase (GGDEF)-like protein/PAS domain S-box-containing protein
MADMPDLEFSETWFEKLVHHASDLIVVLEENGLVRYANAASKKLLNLEPEALLGQHFWRDVLGSSSKDLQTVMRNSGDPFEMPFGERDLVLQVSDLLHIAELHGVVVNVRDMTNSKNLERSLRYQALHDPLTDLPNRRLFESELARALPPESLLAVLFIDLDGFKQVNDTHGHDVGDDLLVQVSQRMQFCLRETDTLARIGGDEFTVLLDPVENLSEAMLIAERIISVIQPIFKLEHHEVHVNASIGVVLEEHGISSDEIVHRADVAMYQAKRSGKGQVVAFNADMLIDAFTLST